MVCEASDDWNFVKVEFIDGIHFIHVYCNKGGMHTCFTFDLSS